MEETTVTLMSSATEAVTGIVTSVGEVVTSFFGNAGIKEVMGIGLGFAIIGIGLGLIPFLKRRRR